MSVVFGGRVMKRLRKNTEIVGASQPEASSPRPSHDVAVREETIREIISNQYNMIRGAIQLIFSNTFKLEYYVPSDEDNRKELHERLRVKFDEKNNWADMSNKEELAPVISVLNDDGILLTRDIKNNNIIRFTIEGKSTDIIELTNDGRSKEIEIKEGNSLPADQKLGKLEKQRLGKLEFHCDSRFLRINPKKNVLYFNGAPSLALEVEFDKSGKSFSFVRIPSFAIKLATDERGIEKYSICHLGYYNVDVMMKKGLEKTRSLIGDFGEDMPTVEEMRDRYVKAGGTEFSRSVQRMLTEEFLNKLGVTLPEDLKSELEVAMNSGSYRVITEVPEGKTEPERVKIFTDMRVRESIEKQVKSKEVLFTEFLLNPELVKKVLENNDDLVKKQNESRAEGSGKFDWVLPLSDRQRTVLSTFVEACNVARESGFDKGLLTLSKLLDDQESGVAQEVAQEVVDALQDANSLRSIRSELSKKRSVKEIVDERWEKFKKGLSQFLPSSTRLYNQVAREFAIRLYDFVEAIKSEDDQGLILQSFIGDYVASMNPVLVTSFIENSYALDNCQSVLKGKDAEIGSLIAEAMDVHPAAVKVANFYYNESHEILRDIGYTQYCKTSDKFADKSQQTQTTPFQERGYGAVDSKSNPYDKLEESENATDYKIEQNADGKLFAMVKGQKVEITPEQAAVLRSLPSADVDGVTELSNSAKDLNKSANRKQRRKQREEAVGDE
jgi:hypothetical protein